MGLENLYNKYKELIVAYEDCCPIICGYNGSHLIGAVKGKPISSFRKLNRNTYIEETYKDTAWRYCYVDESTILKQIKENKICKPPKKE